jgi:hypothetical protein
MESKQLDTTPQSKLLGIARNESTGAGAEELLATVGQIWRKIVDDARDNRPR